MAREQLMSGILTGYFDVRQYKEGLAREQRRLLSQGETISFSTSFEVDDPKLQQFIQFAKPVEKNGVTRYFVSFKINANCFWFDENAQPAQHPDHSLIENKLFEVNIRYSTVIPQGVFVPTPQNPVDKRARGYWANAIQFREVVSNPFQAMADAATYTQPTMQAAQPQQQPPKYQMPPMQQQQPQQPQQPQGYGNIPVAPPPPEDLFAPQGMGGEMPLPY